MSNPWKIRRYTAQDAAEWNTFAATSRNATFLFDRRYMDYHSDRFADCSLIAEYNGRPEAMLPANITADGTLHSHQGLTYGGWMLPPDAVDGAEMLLLFGEWINWARAEGITAIDYKPLPWIFHRLPSQEDIYALFRSGARIAEVNLSSTIDMSQWQKFDRTKQKQVRRVGRLSGITIEESRDYAPFWELLNECLAERHEAAPVHSLPEIELLASRFPKNIRLFTLSDPEGIQCGICIYDTGIVAHAQYSATTPKSRDLNYLGYLYHWLLKGEYASRRYFDFGTSNESHGHVLNSGLIGQKFRMSGRGTAFARYEISL